MAGADDVVFFAWHSCNLRNLGRVPPPEPTDRILSPFDLRLPLETAPAEFIGSRYVVR